VRRFEPPASSSRELSAQLDCAFTSIASGIRTLDGENGNEECRMPVTAICFEEKRFYAAGPHWKHNAQPAQVVSAVPC